MPCLREQQKYRCKSSLRSFTSMEKGVNEMQMRNNCRVIKNMA